MKKILLLTLVMASCSDDAPVVSNNSPNNTSNQTVVPNNTTGPNNPQDMGEDQGPEPEPAEFGLDQRPPNTTCVAPERPTSTTGLELERAFSSLSFNQPLAMKQAPGSDTHWYLLEQPGRIWRFENRADVAEREVFIDYRDNVVDGGERGMLGFAFHPGWPQEARVFISYTANINGNLHSIISEFSANQDLASLDPASERRILEVRQPYSNHNGGQIDFGPDGYLYISLGDGGSGGDPDGNGQNIQTMLGSILRIDVDGAQPYEIPSDNPFVGQEGADEIFAWGLRNVWRFGFDRETGTLWAGDVGQNAHEEISIIELGGNYGWNRKEGFECFGGSPCEGNYVDPVVDYPHSQGRSVTGGYVYRGAEIPALVGTYLFGDYVSGRIWRIVYDSDGQAGIEEVIGTGFNVSSFAEANNGELFVLNYGGTIHRIQAADQTGEDNFPRTLSATGCANPEDPTAPAAGLIPYRPQAEFWSDGADKFRWMALPEGQNISIGPDGDFDFPNGTVLVKSFELEGKLIETRLFVRHDDGEWAGYSYEWRDDQSDADLLLAGKTKEFGAQTWIYPSRSDCMVCHTSAAGRSLGLELGQLDHAGYYASTNRLANQVNTLENIGLISDARDTEFTRLVDPQGGATLDERAQSYMHTNCAGCHRSDATLRTTFDLRAGLDLSERGLCDGPVYNTLDIPDAALLAPGSVERSLIYQRTATRGVHRMPPIGSTLVDEDGVSLLGEWIQSLENCE